MQVSEPVALKSPGLKAGGWKVVIPGNRPLATPAVKNGRVFIGGGFGSHEFYAFDAETGRCLWIYHTHDDGPTAAIVEDDLVLFNTESCELEALSLEGKSVWKKWLGDPLMSMPAAGNERVFVVFPDSRGDRRHYLGCFHLRSGHEMWRQPLSGDVITAPILADDNVYLTTLDGNLYSFRQQDGQPISRDARNATSSPTVWRQQCFFSRRQAGGTDACQTESLSNTISDYEATRTQADYLDYAKRKVRSVQETMFMNQDTIVGFASFKGDSKMHQAQENLGQGTVSGIWSFQGSRPVIYRERLYGCMGEYVQCLDPLTGQAKWKTKVVQGSSQMLDHALAPPALVNGKVFIGTKSGDLACLSAESGQLLWNVGLGEPVVFQPSIANGRVFVPTSNGSLFCVETGDQADDGWLMWGGGPGHNGIVEELAGRPM
jgi:Ca-activated chloride channel homolog